MRYILLILALAIVYIVLARSSSIAPAKTAITESMEAANPQSATGTAPAPHTNAFKAPLDRTHEVLDTVRKQKSADQF